MAMKPIDVVRAVLHWQASPFHPLTCGINSRHPNLTAVVHPDGYAVMVCIAKDCDYAQRYIPDVVFKYWKHTKPKRVYPAVTPKAEPSPSSPSQETP